MDIQHGNAFFARLLAPRRVMQRMDLHATAAVTFYAMASTAQDQQLLGICGAFAHHIHGQFFTVFALERVNVRLNTQA